MTRREFIFGTTAVLATGGVIAVGRYISSESNEQAAQLKEKDEEINYLSEVTRRHNIDPALTKRISEFLDTLSRMDYQSYRQKVWEEKPQHGGRRWEVEFNSKSDVVEHLSFEKGFESDGSEFHVLEIKTYFAYESVANYENKFGNVFEKYFKSYSRDNVTGNGVGGSNDFRFSTRVLENNGKTIDFFASRDITDGLTTVGQII